MPYQLSGHLNTHYYRMLNCSGQFWFPAAGKRVRRGEKVTVNRESTAAGASAHCSKPISSGGHFRTSAMVKLRKKTKKPKAHRRAHISSPPASPIPARNPSAAGIFASSPSSSLDRIASTSSRRIQSAPLPPEMGKTGLYLLDPPPCMERERKERGSEGEELGEMEKESEVEDTAVPLPRSCPRRQIRRRRRWRRPAVAGSGPWIRFDTGEEGEGGSQPVRTAPPPPASRRGSTRPAPPPRTPPSPTRPAPPSRAPLWPREPPWAPPCAPPESGATAPYRRKERKDDGE